MANRTSFTAPGQREAISRGERTHPRVVIGQAVGWAACASAVAVFVLIGVLIYHGDSLWYAWRYLRDTWRVWALLMVAPWPVAAVLAVVVLTVELFDPNWPPPRRATGSTRPLTPISREREQPKQTIKIGLDDLMASLEAKERDDDGT